VHKQEAKQKILKLVEKYQRVAEAGKISSYNEAQTRNEFIEPLFGFLGWDMRNLTNDNEVTTEESVSGGRVDLAYRLNKIPVMFLEAKSMKVDLDDWKWASQAINYSWNKSVTWAVLTDFESIKIFNAEIPPKNIAQNLFIELKCIDYISRFDQLWLLSKESFEAKLLDKEAIKWGKLTLRKQVGVKLFEDLMAWRILLTKEFKKQNELSQDELDEGVQRILDRLIFIRTAEDRKIEQNVLMGILRSGKTGFYHQLVKKFRDLDEGFNSKLFARHYCEEWKADDKAIAEVVNGIYETRDGYRYDFSAISSDVLGGIYEQYLNYVQGWKSDEKQKAKRKAQGIYYTPKYIVDCIVKETLGVVLENIKPKDIPKIKVLDPACGSGSFLTAVFDEFLERETNPTLFAKFDILKDNIYGVDLDVQAIEIAQLNLLLKVLTQKTKLPSLQHNLSPGNSLVSGGADKLEKYFGTNYRDQRSFNYEDRFHEVFKQGGFDVVISNPPWVSFGLRGVGKLSTASSLFYRDSFNSAEYKLSTYAMFLEVGIKLLKENGYLGFIVPDSFLIGRYFSKLRRFILDTCEIKKILFTSYDVFSGKATTGRNVIIILKKENKMAKRIKNQMVIKQVNDANDISINNINTFSYQQSYFENIQYNRFRLFFNQNEKFLVEKIEHKTVNLGNYMSGHTGVRSLIGQKNITSKSKAGSSWKKGLTSGSQIGRYWLKWESDYINIDPNLLNKGGWDPKVILEPKLLIRQTGDRVYATLDNDHYYHLNNIHSFKLINNGVNINYILAILNSKMMSAYYLLITLEKNRAMAQTDIETLEKLPIKYIKKDKQNIFIEKVDQMLTLHNQLQQVSINTDNHSRLKSEIEKLDNEIDREVYKLYDLTTEEIRLIEQ